MEINAKTILITIASVLGIFAILFVVYSLSNTQQAQPAKEFAETRTLRASDHIKWSKNKKIILTEYADLQCPACKNFHDIIAGMETSPADKDIVSNITLVYRHYPLQQIHKNAMAAAYLAEAASRQDKFFEAADTLYDSQEIWEKANNPKLEEYLKDLKLDAKKLEADRNSKEVKDAVAEDIASGNRVGVSATPTFFLNGKKLEATSVDDFKAQLRQAVKANK